MELSKKSRRGDFEVEHLLVPQTVRLSEKRCRFCSKRDCIVRAERKNLNTRIKLHYYQWYDVNVLTRSGRFSSRAFLAATRRCWAPKFSLPHGFSEFSLRRSLHQTQKWIVRWRSVWAIWLFCPFCLQLCLRSRGNASRKCLSRHVWILLTSVPFSAFSSSCPSFIGFCSVCSLFYSVFLLIYACADTSSQT